MMKFKQYLLLLLMVFSVHLPSSAQEVSAESFVILYDEGHEQFFTHDLMKTALSSLSSAFSTSDKEITVSTEIIIDEFDSTNLQGSDLVIVSNPSKSTVVGDDERQSLTGYITDGGSVLYMSNPFSHNSTISGHAKALNDLILTSFDGRIYTDGIDNDNVSIIIDDFNNVDNSSFILVDKDNIESVDDVFLNETNNLTESQFLLYSAFIDANDAHPSFSGNASEYSYAVDKLYENQNTFGTTLNHPRWMAASNEGSGRIMLIGSTIMFSDYLFDSKNTWIDQESNLGLFQNLIAWLLQITPLPKGDDIVDEKFSFFAVYNLLFALGATLIVLTIWIGSLIRSGKLSRGSIFIIKMPTKSGEKKSKSQTKKTEIKKKQKQKRKRT